MSNRELVKATVAYYDGVDSYGQQLASQTEEKTIECSFGIYKHTLTDDIRYNNITHYILTKDRSITDKCKITIDDIVYKVNFVNNYGRLSEAFLTYDSKRV